MMSSMWAIRCLNGIDCNRFGSPRLFRTRADARLCIEACRSIFKGWNGRPVLISLEAIGR